MSNSRSYGLLVISALSALSALAGPAAAGELPRVGIGAVLDGDSAVLGEFAETVRQEILVLTEGEFEVGFEAETGDWTEPSVAKLIDRMLEDPSVDLVLGLGTIASHSFCCLDPLPKPVIAALVIDPDLQNLPRSGGTSGVPNLNYLAFPSSVESDMEQFLRIVPFEKLAVVFNRWFVEAVPALAERFPALLAGQAIEPRMVLAGDSVDEALASIPDDAEAVYTAPLLHLSEDERRRFYDGLNQRRLPSFSVFGVAELEYGAMVAQRDHAFYQRLARRLALNVQRILLGEDAGTIPVTIPDRQLLTINMAAVRATDQYPPWEILAEAELVNEEVEFDRRLSLDGVVREAIEVNLDLLARRREVAAGEQETALARSLLRPRIDVSAGGVAIDEDRTSPFSPQGEVTYSGGLTLGQVLYSEPLAANLEIQRQLQLGREQSLAELRLDIAEEAAVTYLGVLRAKTFERIRKSDLRLTRSNLELARVRQAVGTAGPGEVYRWESRLAGARLELTEAQASRLQAQEAMNRLLHRWQSEGFDTEDVGLDDPELITSKERIYAYTISPRHLEVFANFTIEYGLERAPELAQLDAAIAAQERALKSARRSFWSPEAGLQASLERILGTSGAAGGGGEAFGVEVPDDTSWSVAIQGSLPLFAGGARRAEVIRAEETLARLELEREALAERLEQRIRAQLHQTRASFAGIRLSNQAAAAARKTLDVVTDSYTRGAADILDLLDAQSAALTADLAAADALYQFFIDLIELERAINRLDFFTSPEEDEAWFADLDAYFENAGVEPRPRQGRGW